MLKKLYLFIICSLLASLSKANNGELYTSSKLPSTQINCITQDIQGFIWIGTDYGLSKFDGYRFTNFFHNKADTTSLSSNIISDFLTDSRGNLWIGTSRGLNRYDYSTNSFRRYRFPDGRTPRIYSIIENHKGDVLLGTAGYGLYTIHKGSDVLRREKQYAERDSDVFFTHIYEDSRHYLWQSSHLPTFTRFQEKGGYVVRKNFKSPCGAPVAFMQRSNKIMTIVCMYGILEYDYTTATIREADYDLGTFKGNITINNATIDKNDNLYISTSEHGALLIARGTKRAVQIESDNHSINLSTAYINDIFEDKDHNLWFGCYKKGLYQMNHLQTPFNSWSFSAQNYITGCGVSSIAHGANGLTWCTVQNSGVYGFDPSGHIVAHPASPTGTSIIYRDRNGNYWVGTGNALYAYNPLTGTATQKLNFASAGIYCMTDDADGRLYISVYSKGLYIYNIKTGEVKVLNSKRRTKSGYLCNDWIRAMAFDGKGHLWIGTSNGVACLNTRTLSFYDYGWLRLLGNKLVNSICIGSKEQIIIGTDEGLYSYNIRTKTTNLFPHAEILNDKQISNIVCDRIGDLWVSTTNGIWQYDTDKKRFIGHTNGNGLASKEYIQGAMMHNADDLIGFGTSDGITIFFPNKVRADKMELGNVFLTNFIVNGKSIDCLQTNYELGHDQNTFTLEFSLLNYKNASNISYQYRINGSEWNSTSEGVNAITFNNMEPGDYLIDVRAESNGNFSQKTTSIRIRVLAPWYETTWAYLFYFIIIGSLAIYLLLNYERRRKSEMDESKMRFLINATHDIRSPLTLIMGPLNKLKERIKDYESQQDIAIIDRNAKRLMLLVNQILDERRIDKDQMRLHCQETNIVEFTRGICALFQFNAKERGITMSLQTDDTITKEKGLSVWIDRINFDKVISNILSNALKYTFDGKEITIIISRTDHSACIKVVDTGIGFKDENTTRLFERFYQGKNSSDLHIEGTGIGLNLSKAITEMHGGTITAYNRTDGQRGACIEIHIPLGNKHLKPEEIMEAITKSTDSAPAKKKQASKNFNVLIVDDNEDIGQYISAELSDWYRFGYAPNGKEGLKMLLTGKYDLVISDVMMPEMDGITMLKNIKSNSNISDIPVILLTSKAEVESRLEGLKRGADAFLAKPFNMEELHILIDNLVDNVRRLKGKYSGAQGQIEKVEQIEVKGNNDALMDRIMKCINNNITDPDFNVEKLTEDAGISRAQLHRKMKEITGVSTGEFIRNLRLKQAAHLLTEGKVNITQVAYAVGFNNQTHFSTVFKKHFGMTPTEYAETKRNEK